MTFKVRMSDEEVNRRIRTIEGNRLTTLVEYVGKSGTNLLGKFLCVCGNTHVAQVWNVLNGRSHSCGCRPTPVVSKFDPKAKRHHPLYVTYSDMRRRCYMSQNRNFKYYGARGINVCDRWLEDFWAFVSDMGDKPTPKHTLDRINNDGNYEPSNCRWATQSEQLKNRRKFSRSSKS